jgi:hypothetical protein
LKIIIQYLKAKFGWYDVFTPYACLKADLTGYDAVRDSWVRPSSIAGLCPSKSSEFTIKIQGIRKSVYVNYWNPDVKTNVWKVFIFILPFEII